MEMFKQDLVDYANSVFETLYDKDDIPSWVNFDMFRTETIIQIKRDVISSLDWLLESIDDPDLSKMGRCLQLSHKVIVPFHTKYLDTGADGMADNISDVYTKPIPLKLFNIHPKYAKLREIFINSE